MPEEKEDDVRFRVDPGGAWPPLHVAIEPYDPAWRLRFEAEKPLIHAALGDLVTDVIHVGSTAVPGLAAKPIVDIVAPAVGMPSAEELERLQDQGYVYRRETGDSTLVFLGKGANHSVHLQIYPHDSPRIEALLALRDYLRAHAAEADRYAALKRELAERHGGQPRWYGEEKREWLLAMNEVALRWFRSARRQA